MNREQFSAQQALLAEQLGDKSLMVSGATGLVGSAVVRYLAELNDIYQANIRIIPLFRDEEKIKRVHSALMGKEYFYPKRYTSNGGIDFDGKVDYIVHAAGISGGSKMHLKDPVKIFDIGINGTRTLLDYASTHGCQGFVYVSTYEIYGSINQEALIPETNACQLDPMSLRNSYAEVKRVCESMLVAYSAKYGFNVYSGRLTSTFGSGVDKDDPRFFAEFARCVAAGKNIVLKSTGGTVRNYLDVDDAASAFLYILTRGESGRAYNLTNRYNAVSIRDIAKRLIEIGGNKVELIFDIAEDIKRLGFRKEGITLMDPSRLEALGWQPVYSFDETLGKLLKVFQA